MLSIRGSSVPFLNFQILEDGQPDKLDPTLQGGGGDNWGYKTKLQEVSKCCIV